MDKYIPEDVRQGKRLNLVWRILLLSLGLAVVSLALVFWFTA
jgi:hypothetical protein